MRYKTSHLIIAFAMIVLIGSAFITTPATNKAHAAVATDAQRVIWPVDTINQLWNVINGYVTKDDPANDHSTILGQSYGLDLQRGDGYQYTKDTPVTAPVSGTVQYHDDTSHGGGGCLFILIGDPGTTQDAGTTRLKMSLCHLYNMVPNGTMVYQNQTVLGNIAEDTVNGDGNTHLHMNLYNETDTTYSTRQPVPFTGDNHIGKCPDLTTDQTWKGTIECGKPGGIWREGTPSDGQANTSVATISVQVTDGDGSGLDYLHIGAYDTVSNQWHIIAQQTYDSSVHNAGLTVVNWNVPSGSSYVLISFDVKNRNGVLRQAPMGIWKFCPGSTCSPYNTTQYQRGPGGGQLPPPDTDNTVDGSSGGSDPTPTPNSGSPCTDAPTFTDHRDGDLIVPNVSTIFHWNAPSSCTPDGYTFRVNQSSDPEAQPMLKDEGTGPSQDGFTPPSEDTYYIHVRACHTCTPFQPGPWTTIRIVAKNTCSPGQWQVSLFAMDGYNGTCHTFDLGQVNDLSPYGLSANITSIKIGTGTILFVSSDTNRQGTPGQFTSDQNDLTGNYWNDRIQSISVEQLKDHDCSVDQNSANGVLLIRDTAFSTTGGCKLITSDQPDLFPLTWKGFKGIKFLGSYRLQYQAELFNDANYGASCGTYYLDTSDLVNCSGVDSVRITQFTPPPQATNIAPLATRDHAGSDAVVDGDLSTNWGGTNKSPLGFVWSSPQTIQSVVAFDRPDSTGQTILKMDVVFSDGTIIPAVDMNPMGTRCINIMLPTPKTIRWINLVPTDASAGAGFSEVQVFANDGTAWDTNNCARTFTLTPVQNTSDDPVPLGQETPANCTPNVDQVTFYTGRNYSGQCVTWNAAQFPTASSMWISNDSLSSVKIGSNMQVEICQDENYGGGCTWLTQSDADLNDIGWDNVASSAQVLRLGSCIPNADQVALYTGPHYSGQCITWNLAQFPNAAAFWLPDNSVASVLVGAHVQTYLCSDNNYGGTCKWVAASDGDLSDIGMNNTISSVQITWLPSCSPNTDQVTLYTGPNYTGECITWNVAQFPNAAAFWLADNSVASLKVGDHVKAELCSDNNYGGTCVWLTQSDADITDVGLNNQVSSVQVAWK